MGTTAIVAYLVLFATVGFLFIFAALAIGWFLRAKLPSPEKLDTYECGEPSVGSSFVQFDLRFYVIALVFIVFDVEVAFFFPWAVVFGNAAQLKDPNVAKVAAVAQAEPAQLSPPVEKRLRDLGVRQPTIPDGRVGAAENTRIIETTASRLALTAMIDIGAFFAVLMVGFAYVWFRGDLDWVRAVGQRPGQAAARAEAVAAAVVEP